MKLELEHAAYELTSNIRDALTELKLTAQDQDKRISAKPKKGYICVLTALEGVELETQFIFDIQKIFSPIKAHALVPVYSMAQFIRSNGGINYSVERLRDYLTITATDSTDPMSIYANSFYGSLLDIHASTSRSHLRQSSSPLPYCAFCWRRVEDSAGYCQIHHPNQSKRSFYKTKSALISALKHSNSKYLKEYDALAKNSIKKYGFSKYAFKWTASFASHPALIARYLNDTEVSDKNIEEVITQILRFTKDEYPESFQLLTLINFSDISHWQDFVLLIINALDPIESTFWEAEGVEEWMSPNGSSPNIMVLLTLLQRHEALQYIGNLPRPRGPTKGAILPSRNEVLRQEIKDLIQLQVEQGQKKNMAEIARQLGLSRQRISYIMKEPS